MRSNNNIFHAVNHLFDKVDALEKRINSVEEELEKQMYITRCQLMRVKNSEQLPDDYLLNGRPYNDLSPEKAFQMYNNLHLNFVVLDVSKKEYTPARELPEAIKIPLDELAIRHTELDSKIASYVVISEDGTSSILACEMLNRFGFYNLNNVSGGYKFWPSIRNKEDLKDRQGQETAA